MKKGIGIDIVEIERIKQAVKQYGDKFLDKVFTQKEIKYCRSRKSFRYPELAVRFAAKESYSKAIGTGMRGIHWKEIEVMNIDSGKPCLKIKGKVKRNVLVSLSHSRGNAIACVLVM